MLVLVPFDVAEGPSEVARRQFRANLVNQIMVWLFWSIILMSVHHRDTRLAVAADNYGALSNIVTCGESFGNDNETKDAA